MVGQFGKASRFVEVFVAAVLRLEAVVRRPVVADVRVQRARAVEPRPSLVNLAIGREERGDGRDDPRIVVASVERRGGLVSNRVVIGW